MKLLPIAVALTLAWAGQTAAAESLHDRAVAIAQKHILIDTHIDVPYRLEEDWEDVSQATKRGNFDYPRAVKGGLNAPFMSIYIPASLEKTGGSYLLANKLIDSMEALVGRAPDKFAMAYSSSDIERNFNAGKLSLALGMENGSPIEGKLENLTHFYKRGIRYITLAHSESNHIADSSYDIRRPWKGLSPFGEKVVVEMNRLGIMIDISHVSDKAFYKVIELTKAPVIASHSSLRAFVPGFERNMDDEMIKALAKNGGVIQINFGSSFVVSQANQWGLQFKAAAKAAGKDSDDKAFEEEYKKQHPYPFANVDTVIKHINHVRDLVGIDHVGIGSDFDGVGDSLPDGLKDVSMYPNLIEGMLKAGYSEEDIKKVMSGNLLRVLKQVEQTAASMQKS